MNPSSPAASVAAAIPGRCASRRFSKSQKPENGWDGLNPFPLRSSTITGSATRGRGAGCSALAGFSPEGNLPRKPWSGGRPSAFRGSGRRSGSSVFAGSAPVRKASMLPPCSWESAALPVSAMRSPTVLTSSHWTPIPAAFFLKDSRRVGEERGVRRPGTGRMEDSPTARAADREGDAFAAGLAVGSFGSVKSGSAVGVSEGAERLNLNDDSDSPGRTAGPTGEAVAGAFCAETSFPAASRGGWQHRDNAKIPASALNMRSGNIPQFYRRFSVSGRVVWPTSAGSDRLTFTGV